MEKLEREKVREIFYACLFKEEEIKKGRPNSDFTPVKSINPEKNITVCFCTNRLNDYKKTIIELVDQLPNNINTLEDLYYDINGNKWCDDIQTVDQLIQLALGCDIIIYDRIEKKSINRLKENDNLVIEGHNPEELPEIEEKKYEYTEEEKKLIEKNKKLITRELKRYINTINLGFSFYGYHAVINEENVNQLDFYDKDDNLVYSRQFEDTCGILVSDFNTRLRTEFVDKLGNEINYFLDNIDNCRHGFLLSSPENEKYGYRIELTYSKDNSILEGIEIKTVNANDEYIIKELIIDNGNLRVELNNQFGPYGNYDDGEERYLWYTNSKSIVYPTFFMEECVWPNLDDKYNQISGDLNGLLLDENHTTGPLTYSQFDEIALNITRHPRNKETIEYTLNNLEEKLPGIKELIINSFPIYNYVMNGEYQPDPEIDEMINKTIIKKCNIKEKQRIKKNENK